MNPPKHIDTLEDYEARRGVVSVKDISRPEQQRKAAGVDESDEMPFYNELVGAAAFFGRSLYGPGGVYGPEEMEYRKKKQEEQERNRALQTAPIINKLAGGSKETEPVVTLSDDDFERELSKVSEEFITKGSSEAGNLKSGRFGEGGVSSSTTESRRFATNNDSASSGLRPGWPDRGIIEKQANEKTERTVGIYNKTIASVDHLSRFVNRSLTGEAASSGRRRGAAAKAKAAAKAAAEAAAAERKRRFRLRVEFWTNEAGYCFCRRCLPSTQLHTEFCCRAADLEGFSTDGCYTKSGDFKDLLAKVVDMPGPPAKRRFAFYNLMSKVLANYPRYLEKRKYKHEPVDKDGKPVKSGKKPKYVWPMPNCIYNRIQQLFPDEETNDDDGPSQFPQPAKAQKIASATRTHSAASGNTGNQGETSSSISSSSKQQCGEKEESTKRRMNDRDDDDDKGNYYDIRKIKKRFRL